MPGTGKRVLVLGAIALSAAAAVHAQDSNDVARCAELENADARLACYDRAAGVGEPIATDEPAADEPAAPEAASDAPVYEPMTDDFGGEAINRDQQVGSEKRPVLGKVVACKTDSMGKYYFYFENGQVWKQKDDDRIRYRECDFEVTITRDLFGYKMQVEGEGKKIRIGRIR